MVQRLVALALVAASVGVPADVLAQSEEDTPPARFGLMLSGRQNHGDLADVYEWGVLAGINAGYQPAWIPVGVMWSVLFGHFEATNGSVVDQSLSTVEINFGLQGRYELSEASLRYIFLGAGVTLLRSENTLPPDFDRTFIGPYVGGGYEEYFFGRYLVSLETRYGLITGGPPALTLNLSVNFGTLR